MSGDHPVFALADRFVDDFAAQRPMDATFAGIGGHDDRWGELGPEGVDGLRDLLARTQQQLQALPPATDARDRLAIRALQDFLAQDLAWIDHGDVERDLAHLGSTLPNLGELLELQPIATAGEAAALVSRLHTLPAALDDWRGLLRRGIDRGHVVARRQVRSVASQARALIDEHGAVTGRARAVIEAHPDLGRSVDAALPTLRAAFEDTARFLEREYLPHATAADGVGPERYARAADRMLGADLDVDQTTAWAWDRLRELTDRAVRIAAGIDPGADLVGAFTRLRTDPAFAASSADDFRTRMLHRQETALAHLDGELFDVPEQLRRVEVRLAPPGGALGASYTGPSEDLRRPGTLWWSLGDRDHIPLFEEVSTAYHEGFPGHHLQIGLQVLHADRLSRAHRMLIWNPGYGEGWALYAETLMDELGALEEPMYELGYVSSQLLRIVRVIVDIGLHLDGRIPTDAPWHPGAPWTPSLAQQALQELAGLDAAYAASEVDRYLGMPAQAISYAVGEREILALREARRRHEGAAFDIKAFHHDVLGSGPVGLDHLRELVLGPRA
ncbi:MAG: DUF885 domain-containing protein [Nitriliruptoraceae bacterium]|nr:DUF885 domain-containing protein [Nitriliruptoraceae bacterium]